MPLVQVQEAFDHPNWIFEVKYDGFRALAFAENRSVRLVSRKGNEYKAFRDLCSGLAEEIRGRRAVLDGEIVYLGNDGRPQFYDLMRRRAPQHFYAFDILYLNGKDLRELPLIDRKRILRSVVPKAGSSLLYAGHIEKAGADLFQLACKQDLEGIVAKHKSAPYGMEGSWLKIKNQNYSQAEGRHDFFDRRKGPDSVHATSLPLMLNHASRPFRAGAAGLDPPEHLAIYLRSLRP